MRTRTIKRRLFELLVDGKPKRVDRNRCIIYGVKVLGRYSPNKHGLAEATKGTEYTQPAMEGALHRYQNAKVNVNHPPRQAPHQERSAYDRSGKLLNARVQWGSPNPEDDGIFADLKLIPSHPLTQSLLDAAEDADLSDCFGLSHNAYGRGEVVNGRYVISHIPEVRSVDVVADAGTVRSLFESRNMPKTLKTYLAEHKSHKARKRALVKLLEDGPDAYQDMEPSPAPAEGEEASADDHLCNHIVAIIKDGSLSPEEKKKKVIAALKLMDGEEAQSVEEDDEEDEDLEEGEECGDGMDGKKVKEGRRGKKGPTGATRLFEVMAECDHRQIAYDKPLLESLVSMGSLSKITAHLDWLKGRLAGGKTGQRPVSQAPGARPVQESAEVNGIPKDPQARLNWLRN